LVTDRDRGDDDGHRQGRPRRFTEPQVEVEDGHEAEVVEDDPVARLGRAMAGDEAWAEPGLEGDGDERRRGTDEAIEDDRDPGDGRLGDDADQHRDLETAYR